jgi:hypothetical protein
LNEVAKKKKKDKESSVSSRPVVHFVVIPARSKQLAARSQSGFRNRPLVELNIVFGRHEKNELSTVHDRHLYKPDKEYLRFFSILH